MTRQKKSKECWLNNTVPMYDEGNIEKPCHSCGFCPYGQLVEVFRARMKNTFMSCHVFGHDCPVFYLAEKGGELNR